jgi:hypothetical protein
MKTKIAVSTKLLQVITKYKYNYEVIEQIDTNTSYISIDHDDVRDIFYLGYQMGIEALHQAHVDANFYRLPLVSQDKGHPQGDTTTEDKSAQGNQ